jgi:hypothetical protein
LGSISCQQGRHRLSCTSCHIAKVHHQCLRHHPQLLFCQLKGVVLEDRDQPVDLFRQITIITYSVYKISHLSYLLSREVNYLKYLLLLWLHNPFSLALTPLRITIHSFLSWAFSLHLFIPGVFMSASTSSNHLYLGLQTPCLPSSLVLSIIFYLKYTLFYFVLWHGFPTKSSCRSYFKRTYLNRSMK